MTRQLTLALATAVLLLSFGAAAQTHQPLSDQLRATIGARLIQAKRLQKRGAAADARQLLHDLLADLERHRETVGAAYAAVVVAGAGGLER